MATIDDEGRRIPDSDLPDLPSTGSSDASGGTGDAEVQTFDISNLPFKFNPPMHKSLRFIRPNLGEVTSKSPFYDETGNKYDAAAAVRKGGGKTGFENLRLGRIIMDDMAVSKGVKEGGVRYGFRFLYNPTQLGGSLNVGTDFIPDQRSTNTAVLQKGLEQMTLEVLLNRIPDLNANAKTSEYTPAITEGDRKRIQEQGTQYDLDFLYRCANGIHNTRQRNETGDIGVLLPNPCRMIIGPYTSRGAVVSVQVSDQMFSRDMVPVLSYVTITFARFLNMTQDEMTRAQSYGISQETGEGDGSTSGDSNATPGSNSNQPGSNGGSAATRLTGKEVWHYAVGAGFAEGTANIMTQIAKMESQWNTRAYNPNANTGDLSYGLWQINMLGNLGDARRKSLGISRNDELFNPVVNAKAARQIFNSQGFQAWSVYKNGTYRSVPIDPGWR